jgi:hypothetical protein
MAAASIDHSANIKVINSMVELHTANVDRRAWYSTNSILKFKDHPDVIFFWRSHFASFAYDRGFLFGVDKGTGEIVCYGEDKDGCTSPYYTVLYDFAKNWKDALANPLQMFDKHFKFEEDRLNLATGGVVVMEQTFHKDYVISKS